MIGPPSLLEEFFSTNPFPGKRVLALPIRTLFHAEHLEKPDLSEIVGEAPILESLRLEDTSFISSSSGLLFESLNLRDLVGEAVLNVNAKITDNRKVFANLKEIIGNEQAIVTPFSGKKGVLRLCKALGEESVSVDTTE